MHRETIEFGYTDAHGQKRVFKSVDVTDMTEAEVRWVKNQVYKEMYDFVSAQVNNIGQAYNDEDDEVESVEETLQRQIDNLESQVRVLQREKVELTADLGHAEAQVELLKDLLKEAYKYGN